MRPDLNSSEIEIAAVDKVFQILSNVPILNVSRPIPSSSGPSEMFPMNGFVKVRHGEKVTWVLVIAKKNAQMRDARLNIDYLRRTGMALNSPYYAVFASDYLSQPIKKLCADHNVGYFDFAGNYRFVFDELHLEREVVSAVKHERKRLRSLFSEKASRVMRRILLAPNQNWRVMPLSEMAQVSPGTVSAVKEKLLREEYASPEGESFVVRDPEKLLKAWSSQYDLSQHNHTDWFCSGDIDDIEARIAAACTTHSIKYGFTSFSGARRVAPFARGIQKSYLYVDSAESIKKIAAELKLKSLSSGGNVRLTVPVDYDIFFACRDWEGAVVVNDIQLYLDLAAQPGRGEEAAEFLLENSIERYW